MVKECFQSMCLQTGTESIASILRIVQLKILKKTAHATVGTNVPRQGQQCATTGT